MSQISNTTRKIEPMNCAFLTLANAGDYHIYDHLLIEPLAERGWQVEMVAWDDQVNWNRFDAVLIRSPWDYMDRMEAFMTVLQAIDASSARLENPLEIVRWNVDKYYLADLAQRGCPIVPTIFEQSLDVMHIHKAFDAFKTDRLVIKPTISASAFNTFPVTKADLHGQQERVIAAFQSRVAMLQPFVEAVTSEGEYSLFYFNNQLSHTILKTPKAGDFRVQEEYGADLIGIEADAALIAAGQNTMQAIGQKLLYARVDLVRMPDNSFALMELELIEPSLYFNMDPHSAERFADEYVAYMAEAV